MAKSFITLPVGYQRIDDQPLIIDQLFDSLEKATNFAKTDVTAYVGQIFSVVEGDSVELYIIKTDKTIEKFGKNSKVISYNDLTEKPQIDGKELDSASTSTGLGLAKTSDLPTKVSQLTNDEKYQTEEQVATTVNTKIQSLGNVFTLKGRKDTYTEVEALTDAKVGDVWLVGTSDAAELEEYVRTDANKWEKLGITTKVDLTVYYTKTESDERYAAKADGITAEERTKVGKISTAGDGTKVLTDNGTYTSVDDIATKDYTDLSNKPQVNGVELSGDKDNDTLKITGNTVHVGGEEFTVQLGDGASVGGVKTGDVIKTTDDLYSVLKKLLVKQVPPTYTQPVVGINVSGVNTTVEIGTKVTVSLTSTFTQNDAGEVTGVTYKLGATEIGTETAVGTAHSYEFTAVEGANIFSNVVAYGEGAIKNDNLGQAYPTGHIAAGSKTASKTITGVRASFYKSSVDAIPAASSADIRVLSQTLGLKKGSVINIPIAQGDKNVVFAYPASLGDVATVLQTTSNLDVKGSFVKSTVTVEGANGAAGVVYNVYSYSALAGLNADTFKVTI